MGRALGLRWAQAGHEVFFGSRDPAKVKTLAGGARGSARGGDFQAAAEFGDVVLYTVRDLLPSQLLRDRRALSGKIVVDCNNRKIEDDSRPGSFRFDLPTPPISLAERLAADIPDAHVVQAFNTIPARLIEMDRARLAPERISVFLCADDAGAKATIKKLAEELGFVGVDSGGLAQAPLVENVADFIRFQIIEMGLGMYTTLSIHSIARPS